jgi:hypothetical protein
MISTQFEAWKKVGPWQESRCSADVLPLERDSNRLATSGSITGISLKGNNDEAQKLWGGTLNLLFRLKLVTLKKTCENGGNCQM